MHRIRFAQIRKSLQAKFCQVDGCFAESREHRAATQSPPPKRYVGIKLKTVLNITAITKQCLERSEVRYSGMAATFLDITVVTLLLLLTCYYTANRKATLRDSTSLRIGTRQVHLNAPFRHA